MNSKKILTVCFLIVISLAFCKSALSQTDAVTGDYISMPYFADLKINFYKASTASLFNTLDLAAEYASFPSIPFAGAGPNATVIYDGKLFISVDKNEVSGGVLIYNFSDIFPVRNTNYPGIIPTAPVAGIAIHPVTGDLYVAKFNAFSNSGKITRYSKTTNYAPGSAYDLPIPDNWVNYFSGITFDANYNLWTSNLDEHRLVCFTASSGYDNFYIIGNGLTLTYPAAKLTGGTANVFLLSAPEGFAVDNSGSIWFSNNNDWAHTNNPGEGTFGRIFNSYIPYLLTLPISGNRADPTVVSVKTIPSAYIFLCYVQDAKFGGMAIKDNSLYISDQGNLKLWKWDITTLFNSANFIQAGSITAEYPGLDGLCFNDNTFPISIKTIGENIPKKFSLQQNYPNPFNPTTNINFQLPKSGYVSLKIFDVLGKEVATLVNENLKAGIYKVDWNAVNFPSGVYFYKLTVRQAGSSTGDLSEMKKMILTK